MTTKNNIPAGYKDSAVGIIPQEWEVKRLGACFSIGHGRDYKHLSNGDIPVYGSGGIICYVGSFLHDGETVCIGRKGTINKPFYYNGPIWTVDTLFYTHSFQSVLPRYVGYLFDSIDWMRYNEATGVPSLTAKTISNIKKAVPPLEEQRKIAEILGVWDEAIEKHSRLIEKLELRKRALMQRLLTGRTRLPGFTTPWQKVKLGEIGKISSAGVDKKVNEGEVPVRLLNFVDVFYRNFIYNDELTHWVTAKPIKVEQCSVQKGDIFFTPSSEMPTDIAISAVAMEDMKGVVYSYHIVRLRPHIEMDLHYRAYAFQTDEFYKQAERICDGSGQRYVISQDGFRNMSIHLPSLPEQKAIAEVLTAADNEIATHRKKLDALRLQKRGLMQQLLTGKTRVKI